MTKVPPARDASYTTTDSVPSINMSPLSVLFIRFEAEHDRIALSRTIAEIRARTGQEPRVTTCSTCDPGLGSMLAEHLDSTECLLGRATLEVHPALVPPPHLWSAVALAEPLALQMMSRRVFRVPAVSRDHHERKRLFRRWVTRAYALLKTHGVKNVIHSGVPHTAFEFVLFETARAMGLETHFLMQLQVKDSFVVAHSLAHLEDQYAGLGSRKPQSPLPPLEPRMIAELARRIDREVPHYMRPAQKSLGRRLRNTVPKGPGIQAKDRIVRRVRAMRARIEALRASRLGASRETLTEPFIYLPLHLQPEASTLPLGGVYCDQELVIQTLLATLPADWKLVIKENPKQRLENRDPHLYKIIRSSPQATLINKAADSFRLIQSSMAVATVTGTAGWEALCLGKPALVFGTVFYSAAPGSIHVPSLGSLEALARVLEEIRTGAKCGPKRTELEEFLRGLQGITQRGVIDVGYLPSAHLEPEEALQVYRDTLLSLLRLADSHVLRSCERSEHSPGLT